MVKIGSPAAPRPSIDRSGTSWAAWVGCPGNTNGSLVGTRLDELDGQVGLVSYNASSDEVLVATDPFGMQAVYVAEEGERTLVSTSALCLAKHLRTPPSLRGMFAFLRSGYQFGSLTSWEGIERLEPGTCVRFAPAGRRREIYWRPTVDQTVSRLAFVPAVDHCIEVATEHLSSRSTDSSLPWSDLTAGFDSRLLNLLLERAGVSFRTNTVGERDHVDVRLASEVAHAASWEWTRFAPPSDWPERLPGWLRTALVWGDGNLEVTQLAQVLSVHAEKRRNSLLLFNGGGGEHFRSYPWSQEFLRAGRSKHVNFDNWLDMRLLSPMDTSIFRLDPTPEVRQDFRARMSAWAEPLSGERNTTQLDALYAYKSTGHFGAYHSAAGGTLITELPFYTKSTFTAGHSVSFRHRNHHRLMRHMIERLDPRIAAVETEPGGPAAPWRRSNLHRFLPYYRRIARTAARKLADRGAPGRRSLRPAATDPGAAAKRRAVLSFLSDGSAVSRTTLRSGALYRESELEEFLSRSLRPDFRQTSLFGRLATIELLLKETDTSVEQWHIN